MAAVLDSVARTALCGHPVAPAGSHPNEAWWHSQVVCAKADVVEQDGNPSHAVRFYSFDRGSKGILHVRTTVKKLIEPPWELLGKDAYRCITAFTEVRQPYWKMQPDSWITYHAFTILEIDNGALHVLLERKTDMLEIVIGDAMIPLSVMKAFRAIGGGRNIKLCVQQPRQVLTAKITLHQLMEWIDGPVEEGWQSYNLLSSNCQHFTSELQEFLLKPYDLGVMMPVPVSPSRNEQSQRQMVLSAVRRDWHALKYAENRLRQDKSVVLAAVQLDGRALRYAHSELRMDKEVVLSAVKQNGCALPYAEGHVRQDRDVVLAAVMQTGHMLCYAAEMHRRDRKVALAAVRSDGYAVRYVAGPLKYDAEILMAAACQNPVAVMRLPLF